MTASLIADILWYGRWVLWMVLLWNSIRYRLLGRYRLLFVYSVILAVSELVMPSITARLGASSSTYIYLYISLNLFIRTLESALALRMYWLFLPPRWATDWHLLVIPMACLAATCVNEPKPLFYLFIIAGEGPIVAYFGVSVLFRMIRDRRIDLGWNLKMILFAVTVPGSFGGVILTAYRMQWLPFETTLLWLKGTDFMFWIILAVGMSEYSPPRWADGTGVFRPKTTLPEIEAEGVIKRSMGGTR